MNAFIQDTLRSTYNSRKMSSSESSDAKSCKKESLDITGGTVNFLSTKNSEETLTHTDQEKNSSYNLIHSTETKNCCNERCLLYKKPISKHNYRLQVDFDETPQEIRRQTLLEHQKKQVFNFF